MSSSTSSSTPTSVFSPSVPTSDVARGTGVVLVVLYHMGYQAFMTAWVDISLFFALSGFLITKTTIEAFEVQTFLEAQTPLVCLKEDGQKFGQQFKQKIPPELPHTTGCQCQLVQIYYTSSDVFQGENQENHTKPSSLGDLKAEDARILKQLLIHLC